MIIDAMCHSSSLYIVQRLYVDVSTYTVYILTVCKAGSGQFLVKSDMLYSFSNFSNKLDCIKTKHILWVEVCLVFMKII